MTPEENYNAEELNQSFEEILYPPNLIKNFSSMEEFAEWTKTGLIEDIEEMRKEFEKAELYEHLVIIREVLNIKKHEKALFELVYGIECTTI